MQTLTIGDVTITSIIERDGPWRKPEDMFPAYDPEIGRRHLAELDPVVFDPASGRMVITYQTFVVRTPKHTVLIDTCTGEDKGHPPPFDFPKQPWLDNFRAAGLQLRGHHARVLHAPAHRPHRLEHDAAQRALGADLPEGEVHLPQGRIRVLGGDDEAGRQSARQRVDLQLPADRRGRPGAAGRRRLSARRHVLADPDARAFAASLLRRHPLEAVSTRW